MLFMGASAATHPWDSRWDDLQAQPRLEKDSRALLRYVRKNLSSQFLQPGMPAFKTEQGVEFNSLLDVAPMLLLQPVIQYYANAGGDAQRALVFGFRTKVEF